MQRYSGFIHGPLIELKPRLGAWLTSPNAVGLSDHPIKLLRDPPAKLDHSLDSGRVLREAALVDPKGGRLCVTPAFPSRAARFVSIPASTGEIRGARPWPSANTHHVLCSLTASVRVPPQSEVLCSNHREACIVHSPLRDTGKPSLACSLLRIAAPSESRPAGCHS